MHENREISCTSWSTDQDRSAKAINRTADMNVQEKSDCAVVPVNLPNNAAQAAARIHPDWRRRYMHLAMRRHKSIAKVAMGRRLAVRLYWMWRNGCEYSQSLKFGSYAGQLGTGHGVK